MTLTVNPNTLWSYFRAYISVTDFHMPIKFYRLSWYAKCQIFNSELNAGVWILIWPTVHEIFAWKDLHRVFGFTVA